MRRTQTDTRQREGARRADSHLRLAKLQAAASEWRLVERGTTSANRHAPGSWDSHSRKKERAGDTIFSLGLSVFFLPFTPFTALCF